MTDQAARVVTPLDVTINQLRSQIRDLLALVDTGRKPPSPTGVVPPGRPNAGPAWKPLGGWTIRVLTEDETSDEYVYLTTPQDWGNDYSAISISEARKLAMSILAACDWAESGGPRHPERLPVLDECMDGPRTFICGRFGTRT